MAAITICSDFGAPKIKSLIVFIDSPSICHEVMGPDAMILVFWMLSFKPTFSTLLFNFHQEDLWFFVFCHRICVICISEIIDTFLGNVDYSCASSSPAFLMLYSEYKLNKQGDNIQPRGTPFLMWNQSLLHVQF